MMHPLLELAEGIRQRSTTAFLYTQPRVSRVRPGRRFGTIFRTELLPLQASPTQRHGMRA